MAMSESASDQNAPVAGTAEGALYKRDFWSKENLRYSRPHYRMEKIARLINKLASGEDRTLLDVGCGPATLMSLLQPNIEYHGIDIAIHDPRPNLLEADFLEGPIKFNDVTFDIIVAQGVFEYVAGFQSQKLVEIAQLLNKDGIFVVSYVNFAHRRTDIYWPYSNVQPFSTFRASLAEHFTVRRSFPTSYNWAHSEPSRSYIRTPNMHINMNIPLIAHALAVEYIVICSAR
jgi:SAM-dependent methyltransferase